MSGIVGRPKTLFAILIGIAILFVIWYVVYTPTEPFVKVSCNTDETSLGLTTVYKDKDGNTWHVYCGKYDDFSVHSDVTLQQEQDMQKLVVYRAYSLIQDKNYLPDKALSQNPSPDNSRTVLVDGTEKLMGDIGNHTYNFAIVDASAMRKQVDNLVTDPSYQTKIDSLFENIQLMATNEARP